MPDADTTELQSKIAYMERHIEKQDAEIWRLAQRLDKLAELLKQQNERIQALDERGGDSPVDEKPPHY